MIRSIVYVLLFYIVTALFLLIGSPLLLAPRGWAMAGLKAHARTCVWLLRVVVGTRLEVRGREHLPDGGYLVAAKHQSAWDTFALVPLFPDPALIMKAELMRIPLYGWFSAKFGMIPVKREAGPSALRAMLKAAKDRIAQGRQVLIFPEGTRRAVDAPPDYKPGIVPVYEALGVPCVPLALNSGLFWPRRSFLRLPGTIVVQLLAPIPPGLPRATFRAELEARIEAASRELAAEGRAQMAARA
jgi:1-acyl-sn-glycerol-3-phosphate acyltransferase